MKNPVLPDVIAGSMASLAGTFVGYPLDLVKSRLQTRQVGMSASILSVTKDVFTERGFIGLFRGISAPLSANIPLSAISFTVQRQTQARIQQHRPNWSSTQRHALAGYVTGLFCVPISAPFDFLKIQMQTSSMARALGPFSHGRNVVHHYGLLTLWRGSGIMAIRNPISFALYFAVYDGSKNWAREYFSTQSRPNTEVCCVSHTNLDNNGSDSSTVYSSGTYFTQLGTAVKRALSIDRTTASTSVCACGATGSVDHPLKRPIYGSEMPDGHSSAPASAIDSLSIGSGSTGCKTDISVVRTPVLQSSTLGAVGTPAAAIPLPVQMVCGGLAGSASWFFLHPMDVLKSMKQAMPPGAAKKDLSVFTIMKRHRAEGIRFFFRGVGPTFIRAFPSSAVSLPVFDAVRKFMRGRQAIMDD